MIRNEGMGTEWYRGGDEADAASSNSALRASCHPGRTRPSDPVTPFHFLFSSPDAYGFSPMIALATKAVMIPYGRFINSK
jgi:hypothetical protein